jgi:AcrR family transcriptional regulator
MEITGIQGGETGSASRARVLHAARSLFMAQGYAAVSMQQIAAAVGVNKATLYHHFRDKEDLFVSVMASEFSRAAGELASAIARGQTLREQLRYAADHILASHQGDFGRLSADLREHVAEPRRSELMGRSGPPWQQLRFAVERAIANGEVRDVDPDLVARVFFAMVGSQIWWSKFNSAPASADDGLAATLADFLLDGIASETSTPLAAASSSPLDPLSA